MCNEQQGQLQWTTLLCELCHQLMLSKSEPGTDALFSCCSMKGKYGKALQVRQRMVRGGMQPTVHVYNALLAACERARQW